jgi:hypothetical protein
MNDMMGSVAAASRPACAMRCCARASSPSAPGYAGGFFKTDPEDGDARRAVPFHSVQRRRGRAEAASVAGLPRLDLPASPESRGFVRIKSADPAQAPAIQPRY